MYKIYADDTLIYDSTLEDYKIGKGEITLEIGKAGSFVFSMYPDNPFYNNIVKMKTVITVYRGDEIIFRGRALKAEDGFFNCRNVTCEGELNFLLDSIIRPYDFSGAPSDLFKKFVNEHNAQVDEEKRFKVGLITVNDVNNYVARSNINYNDTLTNITDHLLNSTAGGYLFVTHDADGNAELNYLSDFHGTSKQNIEFGENLKDYTKVTNAEEITTVLIPLGAKLKDDEGNDTDERLTVASVNGGKDYIEDTEAIAQYGRIVKVVEWDDVTEASNLLTKGREKLSELILQNVTIDLNAIDLHLLDRNIESFGYGMYIRVISEPHNLDVNMLCNKQTINLLKPENDTVTLGYSFKSLTESATNDKREVTTSTTKTSTEIANIYKDLNSKNGMFFTEEKLDDGSKIHYIHDRADLSKSAVIWKMTADSIAISTNGGRTYTYGLTADGEAVLKRIYVEGINADYIIAGKLSDKSGNNYFDLDNGEIKAGSGYIGDGSEYGFTIRPYSLISNNMRLASWDTNNGGSLIFDGSGNFPRCEVGHYATGIIFNDANTGKSFGSLRVQQSDNKMYNDLSLGYFDLNTGEYVNTIHLDGLTGDAKLKQNGYTIADQNWVNNNFTPKNAIVTGSYVYNGASTTVVSISDGRLYGKHYVICGTQDAGNPVLRTQKTDDVTFLVYFADPVEIARINYIAF